MNQNPMKFRLMIVSYLVLIIVVSANGNPNLLNQIKVNQFETRCGWFDNPTPANILLFDRYGRWIIGLQGEYQVENDWDWPFFKKGQWVTTSAGSYGYGCACLELRANQKTHVILEIKGARARPLSVCRQDQSLKKWRDSFK